MGNLANRFKSFMLLLIANHASVEKGNQALADNQVRRALTACPMLDSSSVVRGFANCPSIKFRDGSVLQDFSREFGPKFGPMVKSAVDHAPQMPTPRIMRKLSPRRVQPAQVQA